jgi:16S rRNA (cytosine967-C5)-methyltransferase
LIDRLAEQRAVLALGRRLVKRGGQLVYVTCSVLREENSDQVAWFLGEAPEFSLQPYRAHWVAYVSGAAPASADGRDDALLLTPACHGTDGFYVATLVHSG